MKNTIEAAKQNYAERQKKVGEQLRAVDAQRVQLIAELNYLNGAADALAVVGESSKPKPGKVEVKVSRLRSPLQPPQH